MIFSSVEFLLFLAIVLVFHWSTLGRLRESAPIRPQHLFLLLASYYFDMSWNAVLILLIVFSTLIDYVLGARIHASTCPRNRRALLIISLAANLGLLALFKYTNFFIDNTNFDYIVVGLTLWDSVSDEVRHWLARPHDPLPDSSGQATPAIAWPDPAAINRAVSGRFTRTLEEQVPFFRHRTAIQRWLKNEVSPAPRRGGQTPTAGVGALSPAVEAVGAEPVRYSYSEAEQAEILERIGAFFSSLQTLRTSSGAEIMVMLTPFRQDPDRPAYSPPLFYERFRDTVKRECTRDGFSLLDASSLLGQSHFGIYADGPDAGMIDVLHFDASGHGELAGAIEESSLFNRSLRAAG